MVAEPFPEAGLVVDGQRQPAYPLRGLPEVQVGHQQSGRSAVISPERFPVVTVDHPRLSAGQIGQRQVGGVAPVTEGGDVRPGGLHVLEQGVHRDPGPTGVELRPTGDAMDVDRHVLARQRLELRPGPPGALLDLALDAKVPAVQVGPRRGAGRQDREPLTHVVLARGQSGIAIRARPAATKESP